MPSRSRSNALVGALAVLFLVALLAAWSAWTADVEIGRSLRDRWPHVVAAMVLSLALQLLAIAVELRRRRRGASPSVPLRALFYWLVLMAAGFLAFVQPFWKFYLDIWTALMLAVPAALALTAPWLARRVPRRALRAADLVLFNLCVVAVALELGLRGVNRIAPSPLLGATDANVLRRIDAYRMKPATMHWGFPINEKGFYDEPLTPKKDGETLVAVIGDSFSIGVVPHHYHFTTVCERELPRTRVHNVGVASTGPLAYLHFLRLDVLPLLPDAVVIALFAGNDIDDATKAYKGQPFLRAWLDRGNLRLYLVPRRLLALSREKRFQEGTLVAGRTEKRVTDPAEMHRLWPWLEDPLQEEPYFSPESWVDNELWRAERACRRTGRYDRMFEALAAIRDACSETQLFVMLIPDEFQVDDELWSAIAARAKEPLERDLPQRLIGAWLREHGIATLDTLPLLRAAPALADGKRHVFHLRDTHWNRRGNEIAGKALAEFLRKQLSR